MPDVPISAVNWQTIILATIAGVIGLMTTISTVVGSIYLARINAGQDKALENTEATRKASEAAAVSVEKVHVAVNSERTAMLEKVERLHLEILRLSKDKAARDAVDQEEST